MFASLKQLHVMVRNTLLWLFVFAVTTMTWKDWYKGLCCLIVFMAVEQHPDVPKGMLGISGLNPFNFMFANVGIAWLIQRPKEGLRLDLPKHVGLMLIVFLGVVLVGAARMLTGDLTILVRYYHADLPVFLNDYLINTIKWAVPGLLMYDGCRSEKRFRLGLISLLAVYFLLGVQVAKWMPPQYALNADDLAQRSLRVLRSGMGWHRVNLSAILSGASWALLATTVIVPPKRKWLVVLAGLFVVYAQVMTAGRAGYGAWVGVGVVLSLLKWRRYLIILPAAGLLVVWLAPGIVGRATEGFTADTHDTNQALEKKQIQSVSVMGDSEEIDAYTVTAGRSVAWPVVMDKIKEQKWFGFGRQAMLTAGPAVFLYDTYGEVFPHPHNAYLEVILDNGIVGAAMILPFYFFMLWYSVRLFLDKTSPTCAAIGGVTSALLLGLMISALGSQTFYPREEGVPLWAAFGLMLRVRTERAKRRAESAAVDAAVPSLARGSGVFKLPVVQKRPQFRPAPARPVVAAQGVGGHGSRVAGNGSRWAAGTSNRVPPPRIVTMPGVFSRPVPPAPQSAAASPRNRMQVVRTVMAPGWFSSPVIFDRLVWDRA